LAANAFPPKAAAAFAPKPASAAKTGRTPPRCEGRL
jgi:hypothetical protein